MILAHEIGPTQRCYGDEWKTLKSNGKQILCLAIAPDNSMVASGDVEGFIRLWDIEKEKEVAVLRDGFSLVTALVFLNDRKTLLSANRLAFTGKLQWWDLKTKQPIRTMIFEREVGALFAPKANLILTCTGKPDNTALCLREAETGKVTNQFPGLEEPGSGLDCSADGRIVAEASGKVIKIRNLKDKKEIIIPRLDGVAGIALQPDGKKLVAYDFSGVVTLADLDKGTLQAIGKVGRGDNRTRFAFTPDCKLLLVSWGRFVHLFDTQTGEKRQRLKVPGNWVRNMALSRDGTMLATVDGEDSSIYLMKLVAGK
jgi:WD40 repeat protein